MLANQSTIVLVSPTNFIWKPPQKVKVFSWLAANKKVNTNVVLQVRRLFKALSPNCWSLSMGSGESIDHPILHYLMTLELWHKLFRLANLVWVAPRTVCYMLTILLGGWRAQIGAKFYGKSLVLRRFWIVWQERNEKIFEDKWRTFETLWDVVYFYSSFGHLLL